MKNIFFAIGGILIASFISCQSNTDKKNEIPQEIQYYAVQKNENGNWSLVDTAGVMLVEDEYPNEPTHVVDSMFYVLQANGNIGLYNISDPRNPVRDDITNYCYCAYCDGLGFATLKNSNHISCLDRNGKVVFELPSEMVTVYRFSDGLAMVEVLYQDEKMRIGYIDKEGKIAISPKYFEATKFYNGVAIVCDGQEAWYINKEGKKILRFADGKCIRDYLNTPWENKTYSLPVEIESITSDWMPVFENGGCTVKTAEGETVIPSGKYKYVSGLEHGYALFYKKDGKTTGIIDKNGKEYLVNKGIVEIYDENIFACYERFHKENATLYDKEGNIINRQEWLAKSKGKLMSFKRIGEYKSECGHDTVENGHIIEEDKIFFNPPFYY